MSWLLVLNFFFLQWFGWRLARVEDSETGAVLGWTWILMAPLSGWDWDNYFLVKFVKCKF